MKSKNFLIPDGIEYYIGDNATNFDRIKSKIIKIYNKYDYTHIIPPIFDSLENLLNLNSTDLDNKTAYILDRSNGNEIGVRADITPQISKVDYQITNGQGNSKFSYMGDILRLSPGPFDRINPFQTGVEHFGNVSKKIDIEIIKLMIDVISLSKQRKIVIELGDLSFINNLLIDLNISEDNRLKLIDLINLKSKIEIKDFFKDLKLPNKKLFLLLNLIDISGDISVLSELKKLSKSFKQDLSNEIDELISISKSINRVSDISQVQIDLCELHGFSYQKGLIYSAYVPGLRKEIARGGRYTAYITESDKKRLATGFSLDVKDILDLSIGRRDTHV
jgi:ATP phosphoribosyltransferase regulatory subunit